MKIKLEVIISFDATKLHTYDSGYKANVTLQEAMEVVDEIRQYLSNYRSDLPVAGQLDVMANKIELLEQ